MCMHICALGCVAESTAAGHVSRSRVNSHPRQCPIGNFIFDMVD